MTKKRKRPRTRLRLGNADAGQAERVGGGRAHMGGGGAAAAVAQLGEAVRLGRGDAVPWEAGEVLCCFSGIFGATFSWQLVRLDRVEGGGPTGARPGLSWIFCRGFGVSVLRASCSGTSALTALAGVLSEFRGHRVPFTDPAPARRGASVSFFPRSGRRGLVNGGDRWNSREDNDSVLSGSSAGEFDS
jgi:hypothetical protein